ncbi:MAG: hypothetical protein M1825_001485 [Sarcosagium campestre]|nr:MAG: hypothetical protein M1825_001485 [Sarcosagium campestre]
MTGGVDPNAAPSAAGTRPRGRRDSQHADFSTIAVHDASLYPAGTVAHGSSKVTELDYQQQYHQIEESSSEGLRIHTDLGPHFSVTSERTGRTGTVNEMASRTTGGPIRTPSVKALQAVLSSSAATTRSLSPASAFSSPSLGPMVDITPLPSPLVGDSPRPWKRTESQLGLSSNAELVPSRASSLSKRNHYQALGLAAPDTRQENNGAHVHGKSRSISEYVPEALQNLKPRPVVVSGGHVPTQTEETSPSAPQMKREQYLAVQRGLAAGPPSFAPPTPPRSHRGTESSDSDSSTPLVDDRRARTAKKARHEYYDAVKLKDGTRRRWRAVRELGRGTFSRVMLATSEGTTDVAKIDEDDVYKDRTDSAEEGGLEARKLVAVKVVEHGPAGGASEERIESALKRELEIMKAVHHPSLVHLKAFSIEPSRALLVLSYCPGGDLFEMASERQDMLVPALIRRIFSELVTATRHLHAENIVHRDIKLENVLFNIPLDRISSVGNWQTWPTSVVTLSDLGLSRSIDPKRPLLSTRCGSEDYAAPELLMGQEYDGRQTDAWALGVLLYALMEGRLPFDPAPGASEQQRRRSKTAHRIARCDWAWYKYADEEGEPGDFGELQGARIVVEGLLKRVTRRMPLERVADEEWVKLGVQVEGGVRFKEECDGPQI